MQAKENNMITQLYKFKNIKHSVIMKFIKFEDDGTMLLQDVDNKVVFYYAKLEDVELCSK